MVGLPSLVRCRPEGRLPQRGDCSTRNIVGSNPTLTVTLCSILIFSNYSYFCKHKTGTHSSLIMYNYHRDEQMPVIYKSHHSGMVICTTWSQILHQQIFLHLLALSEQVSLAELPFVIYLQIQALVVEPSLQVLALQVLVSHQ